MGLGGGERWRVCVCEVHVCMCKRTYHRLRRLIPGWVQA